MDRIAGKARALWSRGGRALRLTVLVLVPLVALPLAAWRFWPGMSHDSASDVPMLCTVEKGTFIHEITERGSVESARNVEVRCEVQAQNSAGTRIVEIIPEGTIVKKGDLICRLDSSAWEDNEMKEEGVVAADEAAKIQAESDWSTAQTTLEEYKQGLYEIAEAQANSASDVAKEDHRRAEEVYQYDRRLLEKGYITPLQLEADDFAQKKAKEDRDAAELQLKVLQNYTKAKKIIQLRAAVDAAKARLEAQEHALKWEQKRRDWMKDQIAKCTVKAPTSGQVVYANDTERMVGQEILIQEGTQLLQHQVIVRLPDPGQMQVKAKVNESKIALVREGQPAVIHLDALPDQELRGIVRRVNEYPVQGAWWAANIREYETRIDILTPPAGIRPGLNADVQIEVARLPNAVQVPVQAILTRGEKHYCFVRKNDTWEAREVELGISNDKTIVVRSHLQAGEAVALNAASLRGQFDLPDAPAAPSAEVMLAANTTSAGAAPKAAAKPPAKPAKIAKTAAKRPEPKQQGAATGAAGKGKEDPLALAIETFKELDKNGDGRLSKDELPEPLRARFAAIDKNHDGFIDRREWLAVAPKLALSRPKPKRKTRGG